MPILDISDFSQGVYFINCKSDKSNYNKKLLKNRFDTNKTTILLDCGQNGTKGELLWV